MPSTGFRGWPPEALEFYRALEAHNSRAWWEAHQDEYRELVLGPMRALCREFEAAYGPFHIFRPQRDVRFSRDKSPYKTHLGAVAEGDRGEQYYVQLSADGLFAASGYHRMANDQLARFRAAVADDRSGSRLVEAVAEVVRRGYELGGSELATAPRGYPRDHPRVDLLRHKGLTVGRAFEPAPWLGTRSALKRITAVWEAAAPVNRWLGRHVGPSREPPG